MSHSRETKLNPTPPFPAPLDLLILVNAGNISHHAQTQSYFFGLAPFSHSYSGPRVFVSQVHSFSSFSATYLLVPVPIILGCRWIHPHLTWVLNPNLTLLKFILHFTDRLHHAVRQLSHLPELCIVCRVNRMASALHDPIYLSDLIPHSALTGILFFSHQFVYPYTLGHSFYLPIIGPTLSPTYQNGRVLILPK